VKAEDGVEKSFPSRGRRLRGQRRGVNRGPRRLERRGLLIARRQTSLNQSLRPSEPPGVNVRKAIHSGRKFWWAERERARLVKMRVFSSVVRTVKMGPDVGDTNAVSRKAMLAWLEPEKDWKQFQFLLARKRHRSQKMKIPRAANPLDESSLDFVYTNTCLGGAVALDVLIDSLQGLTPDPIRRLEEIDEYVEAPSSESDLSPEETADRTRPVSPPPPVVRRGRASRSVAARMERRRARGKRIPRSYSIYA
jgi:hypothetical protein